MRPLCKAYFLVVVVLTNYIVFKASIIILSRSISVGLCHPARIIPEK